LPENKKDIEKIKDGMNSLYPDAFVTNGWIVSTPSNLSNLDDDAAMQINKIAKENSAHTLFVWISDDISQAGMDFNNYKTNDLTSVERNLSENSFSIPSFLILCGMERFLEGLFFNASV
jgi:hypothetical protein